MMMNSGNNDKKSRRFEFTVFSAQLNVGPLNAGLVRGGKTPGDALIVYHKFVHVCTFWFFFL